MNNMDKNEVLKIERKSLANVTEVFLCFIILLFPFWVDKTGFFKILEVKWSIHLIASIAYISTCITILMYFSFCRGVNPFKNIKIGKVQVFILLFGVVAAISTLLSPYFGEYNLFIGTGRGEGLINILLYTISFLCVSSFLEFKKRYVTYFSISSLIFSFICVLQYFGFNPFNMYQDGIGTHNVSFMGTIGNVDFVSAFYTIMITVSFASFIFLENKKWKSILHLTAINMGFFIFQIIDVDSGKIGFLVIAALLLPYIILNSKYLSRTLLVVSGIIIGFLVDIVINLKYYYDISSLRFEFQFNKLALALLLCSIFILILSYLLRKYKYDLTQNKKLIIAIYFAMLIFIISVILILYIKDFNIGMLHEIHEILHGNFDDEYGTYRMFLWKRTFNIFKDRPIIGTGPDSFAIEFMSRYSNDIKEIGEFSINDTAANVYFTLLVNVGVVGTLLYVIAICTCVFKLIKYLLNGEFIKNVTGSSKYYIIFALASLCYMVQDFFNLWVVIVTPIYFVTLAICENLNMKLDTNK